MNDITKIVIGIGFAMIGAVMLVSARGTRGFDQRKQAGVLLMIGAVVFIVVGLGWLDLDLF